MPTPRRTADVDITFPLIFRTRRSGRINTVSATFTLRNPIPHVIDQDSNGNIIVGAPIRIRFRLPVGSRERFALMQFRQRVNGGDFDGERNLPLIDHENHPGGSSTRPTYTVTNYWLDHSGNVEWRRWKIIIFVWSRDDEIYYIDPDIENVEF